MAAAKDETRTKSLASTTIHSIEDIAGKLLSDASATYASEERKRRIAQTERSIARARGSFA